MKYYTSASVSDGERTAATVYHFAESVPWRETGSSKHRYQRQSEGPRLCKLVACYQVSSGFGCLDSAETAQMGRAFRCQPPLCMQASLCSSHRCREVCG
jgi:hypothetical protein